MKVARLAILGIALAAGGIAALLATRLSSQEPETIVIESGPALETVEVLVASAAIPMGSVVMPEKMEWRSWPAGASAANVIQRPARPEAVTELSGSLARASFVAGEPMREEKLVATDGSGFMSAILPAGMRAISTEISPETGAGGFILPNDHVDVILTRRGAGEENGEQGYRSQTILLNVRVLAIDQTIEEKDGERVVVGRTATLGLEPEQAETLALARQLGTLHLALRSLTDNDTDADMVADSLGSSGGAGATTFVRYGVSREVTR